MDGSAIIFIVIGAIVIWVLFFRQINPSNKTDDQLWTLYRMARSGSKELDLIHEEMERRGLLGDPTKTNLSQEGIKSVAEAHKKFEESGMQAEMQKMFESSIPEQMFNKVVEISKIKGIPEHEASTYFNGLFEKASLKYKNSGLSQNEADEKGMIEALATEIKKT